MTGTAYDAAIIGGGIAGVSMGAFLAQQGVSAALFEMESTLAYHTTGRSAALFTPHYGPASVRAFAKVAKPFLDDPPGGADFPILTRQGLLTAVTEPFADKVEVPQDAERLSLDECLEIVPALRQEAFVSGVYEANVANIDVHALHGLYVKTFTRCGGTVHRGHELTRIEKESGIWTLRAGAETYKAETIVNAAGAWGDHVAALAGLTPVGLVPKRRTAVLVNENGVTASGFDNWPMVVVDADYVYFQPFGAGRMMMSPADETPSPPCDAQPDELDIATGVARFEEMTTASVRRIEHTWAGLRTFAPDGDLVIGWDPSDAGFFWLAGQGGYGIFTSPGVARYASEIFAGSTPSPDFAATGFDFSLLAPQRLLRPADSR